jgi:hypothetical protein
MTAQTCQISTTADSTAKFRPTEQNGGSARVLLSSFVTRRDIKPCRNPLPAGDVMLATLKWADWFNTGRLHSAGNTRSRKAW